MGLLLSLWAPILLSAVAVFIASSLIHMVLGYHKHDYGAIPSEDAVMEALRKFNIPRGDYMVPHPGNPRSGPGRVVPPRVPRRGSDGRRELRARPLAAFDLVPAQVVDDRAGEPRRTDLRRPDGRHLRLALAPLRSAGHHVVVAPGT